MSSLVPTPTQPVAPDRPAPRAPAPSSFLQEWSRLLAGLAALL